MSYAVWFEKHAIKHKAVVTKLLSQGYEKAEIVEYFDFENMCEKEKDFCPLYKEHKKCHDMQKLNCYLCACPNFRFKDEGIAKREEKTQYSMCDIASKDGKQGVYGDAIHQDCSNCSIPHHKSYIKKHFNLDWKKIMKDCQI